MTTTTAVIKPAAAPAAVAYRVAAPLTERVLEGLPGPRLAWLVGWGMLPFAAYEIVHAVEGLPVYLGMVANFTFGLVNLLCLWGAGRLSRRVSRLQSPLDRLLPADELGPARHPFRHLGNAVGPLAISAFMVLTWDFLDFLKEPAIGMALLLPLIFVAQLGITTFLWSYGVGLFGLDRIGRRPLRLEPFATDPHLGLKSLGSLAFEAFLLAAAMLAAVFVAGASDPRGLVGALVLLIVAGAFFFLSAHSLHRTLAEAKAVHVRWARQLVSVALEPVHELADRGNDAARVRAALDVAAPRLAAAVEVERRALAIQEWPFDPAIVRAVAAILTSATAISLARIVALQFGL